MASWKRVTAAHPSMTERQINDELKRQWDGAVRGFFEETLALGKRKRPNRRWGFYRFPTWYGKHLGTYPNRELFWLYEASTGIFPSIALQKAWSKVNQLPQEKEQRRLLIKEALRLRREYSHPCTHVVPFTWVQEGSFTFNEKMLDVAVGLPAELGCDGVVLWGSFVITDTPAKCRLINDYVQKTLGPYVTNLLNRVYECSESHCSGHGRCIKSADPWLHPDQYFDCSGSSEETEMKRRAARDCSLPDNDREKSSSKQKPGCKNSPTVSKSVIDHSSEFSFGVTRNINSSESGTRSSDGPSRYPRDEYADYTCQCFYGWVGYHCETKMFVSWSKISATAGSALTTEASSARFFLSGYFVLFCVRSIWPWLFR